MFVCFAFGFYYLSNKLDLLEASKDFFKQKLLVFTKKSGSSHPRPKYFALHKFRRYLLADWMQQHLHTGKFSGKLVGFDKTEKISLSEKATSLMTKELQGL
jgi:hypothetical protein